MKTQLYADSGMMKTTCDATVGCYYVFETKDIKTDACDQDRPNYNVTPHCVYIMIRTPTCMRHEDKMIEDESYPPCDAIVAMRGKT